MRARAWIIAGVFGGLLGLGAAPAAANKGDPRPSRVDIKPLRDKLIVLQDAVGGTYVVYEPMSSDYRIWYGTGKTLYEQVHEGRSRDGDAWSLSLWAPRLGENRPGTVDKKKDGTYLKSCAGQDEAVLTELTGAKAAAVLDKFALMTHATVRRPHMLARDDRGVYYYVDKLNRSLGGKGFRVYVGKKGAMKQLPLTDVASDSAGEVFSTKTGDLRLVATNTVGKEREASWVRGERRVELLTLDLWINSPIIFSELGIYKFIGTVCDNV